MRRPTNNNATRKIKHTLGFPIEPGIPIYDRITVSRKLPPDKAPFMTTLKDGKGKTVCRKCKAEYLFEYDFQTPYHVVEKQIRSDFKIFHLHEPGAPKVTESD